MTQIIKDEDLKRRTSMTKENILNSCKKNKLYVTPKLNDVLYLHYQGYQKIENLDDYSELKCLWLECNAISEICGLEQQTKLRCLYLHNNFIRKIKNLENCLQLDTLNLSHNYIKAIEGCNSTVLPELNTLDLSHNSLSSIDGLAELVECKTLSVLDLSHNRIEDVLIVKILSEMPQLHVLTLTGNPVVSEIPSYRKTLTIECKHLTYLDSRPIFDKDRACAEAWKRGGYEEEKREHTKWTTAQQRKITDSVRATLRLRKKLAENRSPSPKEGDLIEGVQSSKENIVTNSLSIEASDVLSKEPFDDIKIDSLAADSIQSDQTDDCFIGVDAEKAIQINDSTTEFEIQNADSKDILSTLSQQNDVLGPLSDISGQCLNIAALSIDTNQIHQNTSNKNSDFGGVLDLPNNEFIGVDTQTFLNICSNDENVNALKSKPNTQEKPKIQVLSESMCSDLLETTGLETGFKAEDEVDSNENDCVVDSETPLEPSTLSKPIEENLTIESTDVQTTKAECIEKVDGKSHSNPNLSSTITFYCESLDDLKEIDSDSDVDIEEV